jgi:BrnA antitoxin of type II toxin-antitoxin system
VPTRADAPAVELDEDFWRHAQVVVPPGKTSIHLRVDTDVLASFKAQGRGHLTRMNAVLRAYMEAHKDKVRSRRSARGCWRIFEWKRFQAPFPSPDAFASP